MKQESNKTSPHLDKKPFKTYVHNVTELKLSQKNYSYFNFQLQSENSIIEGVCYETRFQKILKQKEETQSAIEIADYGLKRSLKDDNEDSLVINKKTKLNNVTDCKFDFTPIEEINVVKISQIETIQNYSMISLIGKLNISSKPENIEINGKQIEKLQCKIGDETGSINVTFWGDQIDKITDKFTYKICNVRVRTFQGSKCLSLNPWSVITSAVPILSVSDTLFQEENVKQFLEAENVDCIGNFSIFNPCKNCNKKLQPLQGKLQQCSFCGAKQIIKNEKERENYSLVLIFKAPNLSLTIFKNEMQELIKIYNNENEPKYELSTSDEQTLSEICLTVNNIKYFYNKNTKIVTNVEKLMNCS